MTYIPKKWPAEDAAAETPLVQALAREVFPYGLVIDGHEESCGALNGNPKSALDTQVAGAHYKDSPIQPIEFCVSNGLGFIEGNIVKYISRAGTKPGESNEAKNGAEDLDKIIHYVQLLKELKYG